MINIMISAGEASGDAHAAHALHALKESGSDYRCFGMGASQLAAAGTELIVDCRELSVIGFVDVLRNYHRFLKRLSQLRKTMRERKPDILVLVDFPDFNLKLAETAKSLGIPVLFYVSPQIWAWRAKRIHRIGKLVDHMAVLFPFEVPYYERESIPVTYVGNPVVAEATCTFSGAEATKTIGLDENKTTIALLPGSRPGEVTRILPVMVSAVDVISAQKSGISEVQFVIPRAPTIDRVLIEQFTSATGTHIHITDENSCTVMRASDLVICASGTATLETALIGTPMILVYKLGWLNYQIMRRLIQIPDIGLVNIVAGKRIVPELLQDDASGENIADTAINLLNDQTRLESMRNEMKVVQEKMGDGKASIRVAKLIEQLVMDQVRT